MLLSVGVPQLSKERQILTLGMGEISPGSSRSKALDSSRVARNVDVHA